MNTLQKNFLNMGVYALFGTFIGGAISEVFAIIISIIYSSWEIAKNPYVMVLGGIIGGILGTIWAIKMSKRVGEETGKQNFMSMIGYSAAGIVLGALLAIFYGSIIAIISAVFFPYNYEGVSFEFNNPGIPIIGGILGGILSGILVIRSSKSNNA